MICEILWRGFRISNAEKVKDFSVLTESKDLMTPFYVGARESLQNKKKGSIISYYERVYLYRIMKQRDINKVQMAIEYKVSQSTLYSIEKEFENPIHNLKLAKSSTNRNLVESPKLCEIIQAYLIANRTPITSKDICSCIQSEVWHCYSRSSSKSNIDISTQSKLQKRIIKTCKFWWRKEFHRKTMVRD